MAGHPGVIGLDDLVADDAVQPRANGLDAAHVEEMAGWLTGGDGRDLPPVVVYADPHGDALVLSEGFHRLAAYRRAGREVIPCEVRTGDYDAARLNALASNQGHGLKRTNEDKRRAVTLCLGLRPRWSNRQVADHCGVSHTFVSDVRDADRGKQSNTHTGNGCQCSGQSVGPGADDSGDTDSDDGADSPVAVESSPGQNSSARADTADPRCPGHVREAVASRAEWDRCLSDLRSAARRLGGLCWGHGAGYLRTLRVGDEPVVREAAVRRADGGAREEWVSDFLSWVITAVSKARPDRVCLGCFGAGCRGCRMLGFLPAAGDLKPTIDHTPDLPADAWDGE